MFLLFSLENWSIWVCGDDDLGATSTAASQNGKRKSMIPLRDNTDYEQSEKDDYDQDYEEEYETVDGDQYTDVAEDNDVQHKILLKANQNANGDVSEERVFDAGHTPTEASIVMAASSNTGTGSTPVELCPKECSCLNDFMDCIRTNLDRLPHVPQWVANL